MATEAQKLISISLGKITNFRIQRGGMSLHKNLLIASVLQKARTVFMEETLTVMNVYSPAEDEALEEPNPVHETPPSVDRGYCGQSEKENDKENSVSDDGEKIAHGCVEPFADSDERNNRTWPPSARCLKRRRAVSEVEEAVNSILPKKPKTDACYTDELLSAESSSSSFTGLLSKADASKMSRPLSMTDLCATEVKDSIELISMPVLAMTV
uniref:Uncharacterized protein n=1 Tax=Strigamia maritima TaxID=126957 RepID=T1IJP8_STRMM